MPALQIHLLGHFQILYEGAALPAFQQARLHSLLAYLLLHRHTPHTRRRLAFLFWPDSSEEQAPTNLRKQLLYLRRALPAAGDFLQIEHRSVQWNPEAVVEVDVEAFELALVGASTLTGEFAIAALQQTMALYPGDLLPGCYDEWVVLKREELQASYLHTLEDLTSLLEDQRHFAEVIAVSQQLLRRDPLRETTYRRLMRLHMLNGDRAAAIQLYQQCVAVLQHELGVEPGLEIRSDYSRLLKNETVAETHVQSSGAVAMPALVGRRDEWHLLQESWRGVLRGGAHFVLIAGEAGIGKSRLAEEFFDTVAQQGVTAARGRAYAAEGRLPYAPLIEWLRTPAIWSRLAQVGETWLVELARLVPELLEERPELAAPQPSTESWQRHRLFEAMARAMLGAKQTLLLVLDDLQWCDQETLEWLHFLLRFEPRAKLLVVGTVRPEEIGLRHPLVSLLTQLRNEQQLTEVELLPLSAGDTAQLAEQMLGQPLPAQEAARLYQDTEGHPLYVVETLRASLQEWRAGMENWGAMPERRLTGFGAASLPPKIRAVIDSRLTQLSPLARKVADLAAVMGRDFTFTVLAQASESSEDELVQGLDELLELHMVRERGADGYDFSHDKLREAVYGKTSAMRRRLLHRRIAEALETVYVTTLDQVSSQIAAHFEVAGLAERAIPAYERAANSAMRVYAHAEAIELFQKALALLSSLADDSARARQELAILMKLGPALIAARGYSGFQVNDLYLRAQSLNQTLGEPPNPVILRGLAPFYLVRRAFAQSQVKGEEILALAGQNKAREDTMLYVEGHYILGVTAFWCGEFVQAKEHLEQALSRYDERLHELHTTLYSQDPGVVCLVRLALVLWYLGYPEEAQRRNTEALTLAHKFEHPFTLAYALFYTTLLYNDCWDSEATTAIVNDLTNLCRQYGFKYWQGVGFVIQGHLLVDRGEIDAGIAQIRAGIIAHHSTGDDFYRPYALAMLAQAYIKAGAPEDALTALDEALASIVQNGDPWYGAELLRLKGELLAALATDESTVEAHFQQALALAQNQQAKSFELRAALSLARWWVRQGKRDAASLVLRDVYDWFNEGFATPDMLEAKAFLDELS